MGGYKFNPLLKAGLQKDSSGSGDVVGPSTATDGDFAQFDTTTGKLLKDGLTPVTTLGSPGADTNIPTEKAVRAAISGAGGGDVSGPAVAVDDQIAVFDSTTGKLIKDGGQTIAEVVAQIPTSHTELSDIGSNTHPQIDTAITNSVNHIASTSNPHSVTAAQAAIVDAGSYYTGSDAEAALQELGLERDIQNFFNGTFRESFDATITEAGGTVTMSLEQAGGGDLSMRFSDGITILDCTPAQTIALTPGSDSAPQGNWIYIPQSTKTLTKSTSGWGAGEIIKVGFFFCQSAAGVQTASGTLINQNWNEHLQDTSNLGHLAHIGQKIRRLRASYISGVDGNGVDGYLTLGVGTSDFKTTSGVIDQMHMQTFPAFDTSAGDIMHIKNWNGDAYHALTDLFDITADSGGNTIGNNKWFNITFWGVQNKNGEHQTIMGNLPSGFYNTQADAENDVLGYDDFTIPREFNIDSSTGFLICRATIKMAGTWVFGSAVDLRGTSPQSASGGASGVATSFADNQFDVFNVSDNTKIVTIDASGLTTGNTRVITMADANVDLSDIGTNTTAIALNTTHRSSNGSDHSFLDQSVVSGGTPTFTNTNFTDSANKRYVTDAEATVIDNTSGTNTGDDPADDTAYNATSWNTNLDSATKNAIRDKIETMDTAIGLNTSKVTNANHTGDVTGSGALTIAANAVNDTHIDWGTGANQVSTADIPEQTNLYYTEVRVSANTDVAANTAKITYPSADSTKVGHISVTQAVNLDTMESNISTNNAKVTNANHTGDVTGDGALSIALNAVNDTHIDWGTGANQVSADDIPDGSTNAIITLTQETNFGTAFTHVTSNGSDHSYIDQDVTNGASPVLSATNFTNMPAAGASVLEVQVFS